MTGVRVALGPLALGLLQGCASLPSQEPEMDFLRRITQQTTAEAHAACPPAYVRVCSGSLNSPTLQSCGCSSPEDLHSSFGGH